MKIAILCPFYGIVTRGSESLVRDVVRNLQKKHTIDIYSLGIGDGVTSIKGTSLNSPFLNGYRSFIKTFKLDFIPFINHLDILMSSFSWSAVNKIITNRIRYDIIWNNSSFWGDVFCSLYRFKTGTPFITTRHGLPFSRLTPLNYGKILGIPLPQPDRLITFTEEFKKYYNTKKITVIPNCIDVQKFSPSTKPLSLKRYKNLIQIEHPIVLSTAALEPIKRIHLLIKAMQKMKRGTLIVTNTGSLEKDIVTLGKTYLKNRFIYLGSISKNDLAATYALCDVFCLPSKSEAFSIAILEALSANKPVVTQYCKIRKQVIGDAGIVLKDASNIQSLVKAIETAFTHDYGDFPRKRALKYSLERISKMYETVMIDVTKQSLSRLRKVKRHILK